MKFSDNLRMLRAKYKLSQQDVGDIVGLTSQAVSKWENDVAQPDNDSLIKLAKYFNVSTDYLLGIEKNEEKKEVVDPLDDILFSKAKDLSDEDKKAVLGIINALKKDIDKELDK